VDFPGDSRFLPGEVVDKFTFREENERLSVSVRMADPGDTEFKEGEIVLKDRLAEVNEGVEESGGEPAKGKRPKAAAASTMLLGITKASLSSESFISAASFQETTKVLTEAALSSRVDRLLGLKENVILGHLIPAGTAFKPHLKMGVRQIGEPLPVPEEVPAEREPLPDDAQMAALLAGGTSDAVSISAGSPMPAGPGVGTATVPGLPPGTEELGSSAAPQEPPAEALQGD